jgi:hypothetical protein
MTSHSRPQRPAAKDYFNPAEQIELLQSIKAKVEKSATSTPKDHPNQTDATNTSSHTGFRSVDFKAHELSLREKLEKAKADREAKAKAEAALRANAQSAQIPTTTNTPLPKLHENKSTEPVTTGPPPPPILNNTNPTPIPPVTYSQTWTPNLAYPPPVPNYGRPPYPYPQPFPQQYGMPPYANGQIVHAYPQWGQNATSPNTPGIPPPPPQPNQGAPNQFPTSQSPPNQFPVNQTHVNQGPPVPSGL